jgi:hypothetical protein
MTTVRALSSHVKNACICGAATMPPKSAMRAMRV